MSALTFSSICPVHCRIVFIETRTAGAEPSRDPLVQLALGAMDSTFRSFSYVRWFNVNDAGTLVYDTRTPRPGPMMCYRSPKVEQYVASEGGPGPAELLDDGVGLWEACIRFHTFLADAPADSPGVVFASRRVRFDEAVVNHMIKKCKYPDLRETYWLDLGLAWNAPIRVKAGASPLPRQRVDPIDGFSLSAPDALHRSLDLSVNLGIAR